MTQRVGKPQVAAFAAAVAVAVVVLAAGGAAFSGDAAPRGAADFGDRARGPTLETDCGRFGRSGRIRTHRVGCGTARRVVMVYFGRLDRTGELNTTITHFSCRGARRHPGIALRCNRYSGRELIRYRGNAR